VNRWHIWIGITFAGELLIGGQAVDRARVDGDLAAAERIFPSQMKHRIAVFIAGEWLIGTPRSLGKLREVADCQIKPFPAADHRYSRRKGKGAAHG